MKQSQKVQSVVTAHELMEAIGSKPDGVALTELSRAVRMTPSRVLRHLQTMLDLQLVERAGTNATYRLGAGLIRLGESATMQHDVSRAAFPVLRRLNDTYGLATFLVRRRGMRALVWLSLPSLEVPHLTMPPGKSFSLSGTAAGRVLLAFGSVPLADVPLGPDPSDDFPDPMPDLAALEKRLVTIRHNFCEQLGSDRTTELYSIAVPVFRHDELASDAIVVLGLARGAIGQRDVLLPNLLQAAAEVSHQLGSRTAWSTRYLAVSSGAKPVGSGCRG